ncbi:MAG: TIGR02757 family protein [Candidatus Methylomirabilia bacterium]
MTAPGRLKGALERLYRDFDWAARIDKDAIQYPLRYLDPRDREVVGLLTACLAYGRVDLFGPWVDWLLARMGPSPYRLILSFDPERDRGRFRGFRYRFNRPGDIAAFCLACREILIRYGSLRAFFLSGYTPEDPHVGPALERFVQGFLSPDLSPIFPNARLSRGYRHLFPLPSTGGPCKRLHLFLRWMVRRKPPDFGLWPEVPPGKLLMPVDTHVENMCRAIDLTRRRSRSRAMVEEIMRTLRLFDPQDPVKYDFSLCHKRMSGDCRDRRDPVICAPCGLRGVCTHWARGGNGIGRSALAGAALMSPSRASGRRARGQTDHRGVRVSWDQRSY